ncbi:hypothetical protein L7F22_012746 [Adiantum nelumboides]|nr:hypothetical protein [Adiantum nelumboides]
MARGQGEKTGWTRVRDGAGKDCAGGGKGKHGLHRDEMDYAGVEWAWMDCEGPPKHEGRRTIWGLRSGTGERRILDNIQVIAENVHFRYMDQKTDPEMAFSFGIKFSHLTLNTEQTFLGVAGPGRARSNLGTKVVDIKDFCIYWNSDEDKEKDFLNNTHLQIECTHLINPFNASLRFMINKNSLFDGSTPQYSTAFEINKLDFTLQDRQLHEMLLLWDALATCQMRENGSLINWHKSSGFVVGVDKVCTWGEHQGFTWVGPGQTCRYLGFHVGLEVSPRQQFELVLASIQRKLCHWASMHLSLAGRALVVNQVLLATAWFTTSCWTLYPQALSRLRRLVCNFLWGGSDGMDMSGLPLVNTVMQDKKMDGRRLVVKPAAEQSLHKLDELEKVLDLDEILAFRSTAESSLQNQGTSDTHENTSGSEKIESRSELKLDDLSSQKHRSWLNLLSLGMLGAAGSSAASEQFAGVLPDDIIEDIFEATKYHPQGLMEDNVLPKGSCRFAVTMFINGVSIYLRQM